MIKLKLIVLQLAIQCGNINLINNKIKSTLNDIRLLFVKMLYKLKRLGIISKYIVDPVKCDDSNHYRFIYYITSPNTIPELGHKATYNIITIPKYIILTIHPIKNPIGIINSYNISYVDIKRQSYIKKIVPNLCNIDKLLQKIYNYYQDDIIKILLELL